MTKDRIYEGGTEFSLWLRQQSVLDSHLGYRAYDVDYIWTSVHSGKWLLMEEKRYGWDIIKPEPHKIFASINKYCSKDPKYCGWHLLCFENTSPLDGITQLNYKDISVSDLLLFLQFDSLILKKYISNDIVSQKLQKKIQENLIKRK